MAETNEEAIDSQVGAYISLTNYRIPSPNSKDQPLRRQIQNKRQSNLEPGSTTTWSPGGNRLSHKAATRNPQSRWWDERITRVHSRGTQWLSRACYNLWNRVVCPTERDYSSKHFQPTLGLIFYRVMECPEENCATQEKHVLIQQLHLYQQKLLGSTQNADHAGCRLQNADRVACRLQTMQTILLFCRN